MRITSGRIALVTSSLALAVAVGGTGYAAAKIGTNDIKNNAITSTKIKDGAVNGNDVKESTLGKVPSAKNADALNGARVVIVEHRSNDVTDAVIGTLNGLTIRVTCSGSVEELSATTSVGDAEIAVSSMDASVSDGGIENNYIDFFAVGDVFGFENNANASERQYTVSYATPEGAVTGVLTTEDDFNGTDCVVSGYLIG